MSNPFNMFSDWVSDLQKNRDETYEKGEINAEWGLNLAADAFLPSDLIFTINKAARGEDVTGEDVALSVVDGVSSALGLVSFGAGKVAGSGLKAVIKGSKIASPIVGGGGSIAVGGYYDAKETTDGTKDAEPTKTAEAGTAPQININVVKQPQKQPESTDTQGLNDVLLGVLLAQSMNQRSTTTGTTNTSTQPAKDEGIAAFMPLILIVVGVLLLLLLIARR